MKKVFSLFIITTLFLTALSGCSDSSQNSIEGSKAVSTQTTSGNADKYKLALYFVKDLNTLEAVKTTIDKLQLEEEPILTEKDLYAYYYKSNVIEIDEALYQKLFKSVGTSGKPFVLTASGERVYLGTLWSPLSSAVPPKETPVIFLQGSALIIDKLKKDGYNIKPESNKVFLEISAPFEGTDKRNDNRIYDALKDAGVLKE